MSEKSFIGQADKHYHPNSIATFTGKFVCPHELTIEEIDIEDIAHALSNICRFGGHSLKFYSVAQHSVIGSKEIVHMIPEALCSLRNIPKEGITAFLSKIQLSFLLHDAGEAYLYDIPRPLKHLKEFEGYLKIQNNIDDLINRKFDVDINNTIIKEMDNIMLSTEKRDVMPDREWSQLPKPLTIKIHPWSPATAERNFLNAFNEYTIH